MEFKDTRPPDDARYYRFRHTNSVFPMPAWGNLAGWREERERIRRHLWLCSGLNAGTAAFKAKGKVIASFRHEGLTVENICIETLPGLYVQGNLYKPAGGKGKRPLILNPHGHGLRSRTVPMSGASVPHRAMNQALLGFAAFAWSMIGYEEDTKQLEHRSLLQGDEKALCNLYGLSMFGLQLNNSIKVLDYLCSRADIDTARIGCTGESGGGTQTYYLAALDERVRVAAPAVMLSGHMQGGCVCENAPLLHLPYSTVHYAGLIAPRPLLLLACTGDWTHHAREREYASLKKLYRLYGAERALACFYQDAPHNYNKPSREAVYAWMKRWLQDSRFRAARIPESEQPVPASDRLLVFKSAVPPRRNAIRSQKSLLNIWIRLHSEPDRAEDTAAALCLAIPPKRDLLIRGVTPRHARGARELGQNHVTYGRFSEDSTLSCHFVLPERGKRCFIVVRDWRELRQWRQAVRKPPRHVASRIRCGDGVLMPLLFAQGSTHPVRQRRLELEGSYLYTSFNKTAHMCQADDIVTTAVMAATELGVAPPSLTLVASGSVALPALLAWAALARRSAVGAFAGDLGGLNLKDPATWVRHAYFPLLLRAGGIKALGRLCGRRRGLVSGVPRACRGLFPASFRVLTRPLAAAELLTMAADLPARLDRGKSR
ncbi:MAG: acetylxylan esterase [Kiritimatiellae bacterium]|nr:acetylxylan esterase [Kiritimatiellia bacterium]